MPMSGERDPRIHDPQGPAAKRSALAIRQQNLGPPSGTLRGVPKSLMIHYSTRQYWEYQDADGDANWHRLKAFTASP